MSRVCEASVDLCSLRKTCGRRLALADRLVPSSLVASSLSRLAKAMATAIALDKVPPDFPECEFRRDELTLCFQDACREHVAVTVAVADGLCSPLLRISSLRCSSAWIQAAATKYLMS